MDSTLLSLECLDTVVQTALLQALDTDAAMRVMHAVDAEMIKGMSGSSKLTETIPARLHLARDNGAPVTKEHFKYVAELVPTTLSKTITGALASLCSVTSAPIVITIVSGGPQECVDAAVASLTTELSSITHTSMHIQGIGNQIVVQPDGSLDEDLSVIRNSKVETVHNLTCDPSKTVMIGDGATDVEVFDTKMAHYFIAVGFWVPRPVLFERENKPPHYTKVEKEETFKAALEAVVAAIIKDS